MQLQDEYADTSQKYLQPDFDTELSPSDATHQQHLCKSTMTSTSLPTSSFHPGSANSILTLQGDRQSNSVSVAEAVTKMLKNLGVNYAFGVSGGGITPFWSVLQRQIPSLHFRHEAGAVFAAIESYFASGSPAVVLTTTGPGITNAVTGILAARCDGAKLILLSPSTSAPQRGRWAFQETSAYTMSHTGLFNSGALFDYATVVEHGDELPQIYRRLAIGLAQPGSFVAHLSIPTAIQTSWISASLPSLNLSHALPVASEETISACVKLLSEEKFAIWVGFGARNAASLIRQLAEKTGAAVMCSPRGKGIFPEDHPQFVGVTGFGGHTSVSTYMQQYSPKRVLVLGTRLGEFTSFWNSTMVPEGGFIHVDIDPTVPGTAYPSAQTLAIHSDVGLFVKAVLEHYLLPAQQSVAVELPRPFLVRSHGVSTVNIAPSENNLVKPQLLMAEIQRLIVEGSNAIVITEAGNSFAWGTHTLQFNTPGRYRVSTGFGAMGHAVTGVLGAALANNGKAVAIVGDGAMLMNNEISTAVQYQIPAVWIVLNDARYNMCEQGMAIQRIQGVDTEIPQTDFVAIARSMGADGIRVSHESQIETALEKSLAATVPFVVDVLIDPTQVAPIGSRIQSLISQGAKEF